MGIEVRPARAEDEESIHALVRSERLNPSGLDWRRFQVACEDGVVVGAVQVRPRGPELASLAVRPDRRRRGLGGRLIEAALGGRRGPVYLIAPATLTPLYERHGFARLSVARAPGTVALDWVLGQAGGGLISLILRRRPRRIVVMARRGAY